MPVAGEVMCKDVRPCFPEQQLRRQEAECTQRAGYSSSTRLTCCPPVECLLDGNRQHAMSH